MTEEKESAAPVAAARPRRRRGIRPLLLLLVLVVPELALLQDFALPAFGPWPTLGLLLLWQVPLLVEYRGVAADREATLLELACWQTYYAGWTAAIMYAAVAGPVRLVLLAFDADGALAGATPPGLVAAAPFGLALYGVFVRQHAYPRRVVEIALPSLPACWSGTRIVLVSDVHVGRFIGARRLARLARRAAAAAPDLVVVTGDTVDTNARFAPLAARHLASIPARLGVFAVLGNHDHYAGAAAVRRAFADAGIHVLRNEGVVFGERDAPSAASAPGADGADAGPANRDLREATCTGSGGSGSAALYLAGVDDLWHGADVARALEARPAGACTVLLSHHPDLFPAAAASGVALMLAGHTHGGQLAVPFLRQVSLARLITRFVSGLYRLGDAVLYVSNGSGVIRPLARIGAAPEIAELVLVAARGALTASPGGTL